MALFIVLVTLFALLSILGHFQIPVAFGWWTSLRLALAGMFLLTASAHWGKRRPDLIRMVPTSFHRPDLLVTMTGVLEGNQCCSVLSVRTPGACAEQK